MVWPWLVHAMTGGRCQRKKKMMGRGKDGGCGTEVKPCPISRASAKTLEDNDKSYSDSERVHVGLDFYTQASKALSERSPFETKEVLDSGVPRTLPSSLATFYVKHADSRKRHKKSSHSGGGGKTKKSSRSDRSRAGSNIWVETGEYFRDLTLPDIEELYKASSLGVLDSQSCFLIPSLGSAIGSNASSSGNAILSSFSSRGNEVDIFVSSSGSAVEVGLDNGVVVKEEDKKEETQLMEIDTVNANVSTKKEEERCTLSDGLEWLLVSKNRILLTSERPSKKRKLLGPDAGLEKLIVNPPSEGNVSVCDFCFLGDTGEQLNKLIVCDSCKVVVHQKCYGMQEKAEGLWLCSWCKQRSEQEDGSSTSLWPCDLCPKKGGALKPVHKGPAESENDRSTRFAHLFCSLWMPEVYVQDTKVMEPIMNIEGIKETRRKLVCNVCKVKCGACIRCSNGACRTSFHPICAREARHRMEIWGKSVHDNVELRAFCSKHSGAVDNFAIKPSHDQAMTIDSITEPVPVTSSVIRPSKLKFGRRNGDQIVLHVETNDLNSDKLGDGTIEDVGLVVTRSNSGLEPEHGDGRQLIDMEKLERNASEDSKQSDHPNLASILHKLIERGKVNLKDMASEIGISLDSLAPAVADGCLGLDSQCKIVKWLKDHACISRQQNNLRVKIKSAAPCEAGIGGVDDIEAVTVAETDLADVVPVKSVPPRRRTKSNIRILKDNKMLSSSKKVFISQSDDGAIVDGGNRDAEGSEEQPNLKKVLDCETSEKIMTLEPTILPGVTNLDGCLSEDNLAKPLDCCTLQSAQADMEQNATVNSDQDPAYSVLVDPLFNQKAIYNSYIHPLIQSKLMQVRLGLNTIKEFDDAEGRKLASSDACSVSTMDNHHKNQHCNHFDVNAKYGQLDLGQLVMAGNDRILELSPEDEVENELVYFQHKLLENAVARKCFSDALICKVVQSLPKEIDAGRKRQWDNVFVNRYLCELKEAKKRGRKEKRHQEAQAVLAAATAAAAASSRLPSFRKDVLDESTHQESLFKASPGRVGSYSQLITRAKETLSKFAVGRVSSEKQSDFVQSSSDFSKEHPRCCDICRRPETLLNRLLVCSGCKASVHLDCYRGAKESAGPWYCELCEELLSSKSSIALAGNLREKPYFATECCVCGGNTGAFRKSTEGQWVHAYCAEWVFESTFRRGQVNPIEGMEIAPKGNDVCCICHRQFGVCIKCNFGLCHCIFHPYCARNAGFFMHVKTSGVKLQHKAYCEKHSLEQRSKIEMQKHGAEELKSIKQRELVLCSHDILASKRDSVALSMLVRTPYLPPDVSSESATTSLRVHTDGYRSCSEAMQRSDDVTVDSTLSGKRCVKLSMSMDMDQKTDDSSTSEQPVTLKPIDRTSFSGKHIPHRSSSVASQNQMDDWEKWSNPRKNAETFEKELVMTSDQASMKNQRLPKGFAYVPVERLSKEKQANEDASSCEPLENDG
ncbi:hypothetical protein RJ641_029343 [Dillenia turbinata]|uniref:Uncharacterized protein n=1 Tax=Dillenia turbinata TaxID=194707 RepID=A0AAN8ZJD1_9MAGN